MYITKVFTDDKSVPVVQHYREGQRLTKTQVRIEGLENHAFVRQTGKETWKVLRNFEHSYESKKVSALGQLAEYLNSQDAARPFLHRHRRNTGPIHGSRDRTRAS